MNLYIESMRGLACILLVAYHVIGSDINQGLKLADGTLRVVNDGLAYFRMPLFTLLSGFVYGLRPFMPTDNAVSYLKGKGRRLLFPMLTVGTMFALLQHHVPGSNQYGNEINLLHIKPVAHFWFVESLFLIFLLVGMWDKYITQDNKYKFCILYTFSMFFYLLKVEWPVYFGISGAIYLLPYFLAGLSISRFNLWDKIRRPSVVIVLSIISILSVFMLGVPHPGQDRFNIFFFLVGIGLCGLCFALRLNFSLLCWIGRDSFPIYIFHVFFTAGARILLGKFYINDVSIVFLISLMAGVFGPIYLNYFIRKNSLLALLLTGVSKSKKRQVAIEKFSST